MFLNPDLSGLGIIILPIISGRIYMDANET